ncbi:hypothetical protein [Alicyclobacillus sp.]|nr:hypothetical protein [Alicyclobacillus sp.]MCL6515661.1 hypothetical protein [Alicyclobacillus sp.]
MKQQPELPRFIQDLEIEVSLDRMARRAPEEDASGQGDGIPAEDPQGA